MKTIPTGSAAWLTGRMAVVALLCLAVCPALKAETNAPGAEPAPGPAPEEVKAEAAAPDEMKAEAAVPAEKTLGEVPMTPARSSAAGAPAAATELPVEGGLAEGADTGEGLRLNFQNAPLIDVLQYLSEAAGFVIIQDVAVAGTVSVISRQPLDDSEAVDLLNTLLAEKGYLALRNGRVLKIVDRKTAPRQPLPVYTASRPDSIPNNDEMATMIIPVGFANVQQLIENLRPLLPEGSTMSANESCNAILVTDTQANARRMAEIVKALDTSVSALSAIRVFSLEYADATETAKVINDLFATSSGSSRSRGSHFGGFVVHGGGDSNDRSRSSGSSAGKVVAVADERSNAVIVGAQEDMMKTIEDLISRIDTNIQDVTEIQLFQLENSDATELADLVNDLYKEDENGNNQPQSSGGPFPFFRGGDRGHSRSENSQGQRRLQQSRVVAIGDPRTNTLIVRAARETMLSLAEMIGRLDASNARTQHVHVFPLSHADVDNVARVLQGMFEGTGTSSGQRRTSTSQGGRQSTGRLSERSAEGASTDTQNAFGGRGTR